MDSSLLYGELPISLCLFTSTKGHHGCKSLYLDTLNHLDRQIALGQFGARYAHIKVSSGEEAIAAFIEAELWVRDFIVEKTYGDWSRGTSHQISYLEDIRRASRSLVVQSRPYTLMLEDDSPFSCKVDSLTTCLSRMIGFLQDPEIVSTRFLRACDLSTSPVLKEESDFFYSPDVNFQPLLLRSRDFYQANLIIEQNWSQLSHLQCELVMRIALDQLSRSKLRHIVWLPHYAETFHLGVPNHEEVRRQLGLL